MDLEIASKKLRDHILEPLWTSLTRNIKMILCGGCSFTRYDNVSDEHMWPHYLSSSFNTNNLNDGDYNAYLRISSNGGNATLPVTLIVNGSLVGDTNGDALINVLDVIIMVNMILGSAEIDLSTADINGDGIVNVLDVTLLLNFILNG